MYLIQSARVVIHVLYVPLLTLTRCQIVATTYVFQRLVASVGLGVSGSHHIAEIAAGIAGK